MSGFFRENNNLAFKNRANIFAAKLRPVAASDESLDFDSSGIMEEGLYSEIDNKNKKSDDLEITEVRLLDGESTVVKDKSHDTITKATNIKTGGGDLNLANQENSNDVLLEAFTNTQRICSNLKQQLVKSHKENSTLKTQLSEFENKTKQLNDKLGEYKKLLSDLKESLNSVKAMKEAQEHTFDEYKSKQATITQKLKTLKTEMEQMNGKLKKSNETVRINETELQNKRKEIDYLKRELDETSGLLSEEKIKNNKILSMLKEEKESMLTYWNKNSGNQQVYFGILLKSLQDGLVSEIHQKTQDTYSTLAKELKDNFQLQISTSTNKYVKKNYSLCTLFSENQILTIRKQFDRMN